MRGALTCRGCGGLEAVTAPQLIRRNTRGNQLAIVGRKQLTLCPACDKAIVEASLSAQQPVPEDYTSVFISGFPATRPRALPARRSIPRPTIPVPAPADPPQRPKPTPVPKVGAPRMSPSKPTVRQATKLFLNTTLKADSTALVLLGAHLGPASRLQDMEDDQVTTKLEDWFSQTYRGASADRRESARNTLIALVDYWLQQDWLEQDLIKNLR